MVKPHNARLSNDLPNRNSLRAKYPVNQIGKMSRVQHELIEQACRNRILPLPIGDHSYASVTTFVHLASLIRAALFDAETSSFYDMRSSSWMHVLRAEEDQKFSIEFSTDLWEE